MITEDLLERGLVAAAGDYEIGPDAVERLRDRIDPPQPDEAPAHRLPRPTPRMWAITAAAALVGLVGIAIAVGGGGAPRQNASSTASGAAAGGFASSPLPAVAGGETTGGSGAVAAPSTLDAQKRAADHGAVTSPGAALASGGAGTAVRPDVPGTAPKVVKTGELDLRADKGHVSEVLDKLAALATLERGYVADSHTQEDAQNPSGQVTLRVPAAAFDDTVAKSRQIAFAHTASLQTAGQDVTGKYVDLQARIKALKATRATFLTLLSRATTIGETLAVQQRVTDVQTQIEQLQGQLEVLSDQASLATLSVTVAQPPRAITPVHQKSGLHRAFDRSVSRFVHGIEAIVGVLGPILLVLMLVALGWLAARVGYRRLRRQLV